MTLLNLGAAWRIKCPSSCAYQQGRPTFRGIHQCTWPKRPAAYVLCHLLCPMLLPDKLFMDSHLKPYSVLMRSTFLASMQFLLLCHVISSLKGNRKIVFILADVSTKTMFLMQEHFLLLNFSYFPLWGFLIREFNKHLLNTQSCCKSLVSGCCKPPVHKEVRACEI